MNHKYLLDLFHGDENKMKEHIHFFTCNSDEEYGFDVRETWALDYAFFIWLYERLMCFSEVNNINLSYHTIKFDGETLTQQQCIDRMIKGCKIAILKDEDKYTDSDKKTVKDVAEIWAKVLPYMWW